MKLSLPFVLLGEKGAGKSASGNTILGQQAFKLNESGKSVTPDVVEKSGVVDGQQIIIYDTQGFCDPEMRENEIQQIVNKKVFQKCEPDACVFLLVIKAETFTEDERKTVEKIEKVLGEKRLNQTWILITRGDKLVDENKTIREFLDENESLEKLIQKYSQRYHVFDNENKESSGQVRILLTKIIQKSLKASAGGKLIRQIPDITANTDGEQTAHHGPSSRRIVLLGKTGVGKSAAGNTILGKKMFISKVKLASVTSECLEKHEFFSGRKVSVIDTPGFFDTKIKSEVLMKEIAKSVYISSPGPHAFLIVFKIERFTEQELRIAELTEILFGEEVTKYAIILFTHGDFLEEENIDTLIEENCALRHLVQECGDRYHVFNNKHENNRQQVNDLLQKIDKMIEQNGGEHYSNEMYEDALRFRQEEEKRKQRAGEQMEKITEELEAKTSKLQEIKAKLKREEEERKQEEKQRQEEAKRARKEIENIEQELKAKKEEIERLGMLKTQNAEFTQFYRKYEQRFRFSASALGKISLGAFVTTCALLGLCVGALGGPAGAAVGAAAGAAVGAAGAAAVDNYFKF